LANVTQVNNKPVIVSDS